MLVKVLEKYKPANEKTISVPIWPDLLDPQPNGEQEAHGETALVPLYRRMPVVQKTLQTGQHPGVVIAVGTIGEHLIFVLKPNLIDETN